MGKSGSCSTRRTSAAEAERRRRNEVSVRSRGIAGRREKEFLEWGRWRRSESGSGIEEAEEGGKE
jgi:hypothetical protein